MADERHATMRALDALQLKGFNDKRDYVASLEARADEQAVSLLIECLCDESAYLRNLAEKSLIRIGKSSEAILLPHLNDGLWYTRASTARILGELGSKAALPGLTSMLTDPNHAVIEAVLDAVAQLAAAGHGVSVARALHHIEGALTSGVLDRTEKLSPGMSNQLHRLMADRELMTASDDEVLREGFDVAEAQDNLEWEVLTGKRSPTGDAPESTDGEADSKKDS